MSYKYHKTKRLPSDILEEAIALIPDCIDGQRLAQTRFYNIFKSAMYKLCLYYTKRDKALAQDLLQEGFIKVFSQLHTLRDHRLVFTWVCNVFGSMSISFIREKKAFKRRTIWGVLEISEELDFSPNYEFEITHDREVYVALCRQTHQDVFRLFTLGYNYQDISEQLTLPINTLKSVVFRCRTQIKAECMRLSI